ncbi:SdrD B-like domain-containing protein [Amycolatopsis sp.]|uniref:SdrD B-like domain-containing protein n=1 Tax=Amycolatopsis sp. TaxID=37632 RepID=UPI002D7F3AE7|nr:SdrD B-like domain-containing protein [Amycolatopsis sp.]HET6708513.1 SdrD B-like domain-containing protein [Amycolatopsis sp.]
MKRLTAFGAVLLLASTVFPLAAPAAPAVADASDGTLTVRVIRDLNGNGNYEPALETGVAGIPVKATDPAGGTATGTTGADGTVKLTTTGLAGGKYRVEASVPASMPYLKPAPAGGGLSSLTSFVDVSGGKKADLTMGLWNPADYCQDNPTLVTACQRNAIAPGIDNAARSLVSFPFTARGTGTPPTALATQGDTGTVYGITYRRADKRIFSSAFAKRAAAYGPDGPGAIYVTNPATKATTLFTKVPVPGTTAHAMQTDFDQKFADVVGKESLGALRISEDGSTLFVVNLADRKLYLYDATAATAAAPKASYAIPNPGCPAAGDWRPGGLGVHDGVVFVGGVCSGESTQKTSDVRVVIRTFDAAAGTFGAVIVNQPLTFKRGDALWNGSNTHFWNPWQTTYQAPAPQGGNLITHPEPLLTDIRAEAGGDLVLGFRDRFGDQGGYGMPNAGSTAMLDTVSGGDLNRVCKQAGGYVWEGTSGCPNNNSAEANGGGEPTDVVEYYPGEYFSDATHGKPHNETAQGGIAVVYGAGRMPATVMDPTDINTGGIGWFDRAKGTMMADGFPNSYLLSDTKTEGWGKANGLADLEALCDNAPVQLGNRVWFDTDGDGVQGPAEPAVAGAKVTLLPCAGTGAPLATKTTGPNGEYYFGAADGLKADTCYTVKFDYSGIDTAGLPGAPPVSSIKWTVAKAGGNPAIDSDADPATGTVKVTMGPAGSVDHTVDAGLVAARNRLGDLVWADTNGNGLQDAGEPGVPDVPVTLKDGTGKQIATTKTGPDGKYLFDSLPDGAYQVCFDRSKLPADYAGWLWTKQNSGDDTKDSDADPATGCTPVTTLGPAKREDLTLDAGIRPPNRLGDFVWADKNGNGLQDPGEPGVPDVPVVLKDGDGKQLATTKTGPDGKYLFDKLPDGSYQVCFDRSKLPADYADWLWTKPNAGDDTKDSDADTESGCTPVTTLGIDRREDLTLDAGLVEPRNRLGDFVWLDKNGDGLQDPGEPGVPDVPVVLKDGDGKQLATTKTGPDGKYLFANLPDGSYQVCFDIAHLPAPVADYKLTKANAGDDGKDSDADPASGCTPVVQLGVGKRENLTLDAGLVTPPNRLGDLVWADKNGNGLQDPGEPGVPGVPVVLKDGDGKQLAATSTGPDGKYLFDNLPDGSYQVCFDRSKLPADYADWQWTKRDAGDDTKDSDADPASGGTPVVKLGPGARENLTLDAGLVEPRNRLGDFVWLDKNGDGLQDPGEPGVPDVPVVLKDGDGKEVATTKTGPDGKYLFDGLPDGSYQVCFGVKQLPAPVADYGLTKPNAGDDGKDSDADPASGCTPVVKLGPGARENLTLDAGLVAPPNRLGDLVWADTNRNGLQDPGEPGVPGVPVVLKDGDGKQIATTKTGPDGKYLFDNLPDGSYRVCFDRTQVPPQYAGWQWVKPDAGDDAKDSDADPASGCTPVVQLGVGKRENLTLDAGLVEPRNRVGDFVWLDKNGNGLQDPGEPGVPDVPVVLKDGNGKQVASAKTDRDGKYLFDGLPDGSYKVCFSTGDRKLTKPDAGADDTKDSDAQPSDGCTKVVTLGPAKREDLSLDAGVLTSTTPAKARPLSSTGFPGDWLAALGGLAVVAGIAALLAARRARETR